MIIRNAIPFLLLAILFFPLPFILSFFVFSVLPVVRPRKEPCGAFTIVSRFSGPTLLRSPPL